MTAFLQHYHKLIGAMLTMVAVPRCILFQLVLRTQ